MKYKVLFANLLKMKKVIPSLGPNPDDPISERVIRAPYFLIFEDDKFVKAIKNPYVMGPGAGLSVAEMLRNMKVDVLVAKRISPKLERLLDSYGIKVEFK